MLKVYKMPNGRKYRFEEGNAPAGAILISAETKPTEPAKKEAPAKKATKPANKARKAANK